MSITESCESSSSVPEDQVEYRRVFRKHVFKLLRMGYKRLDAENFKDSEEPDITGELVRTIEEEIESPNAPKWVSHYYVREDPRVNVAGVLGTHRQILDIEFIRTRHGQRPHYFFEAKRLSASSHPVGKYCGNEGLGKFLRGDYAHDRNEAGMLGYVQSDSPEKWAHKLQKKFEQDAESLKICPDGNLSRARETAGWSHCCYSKHRRPTVSRSITLYHILLVFC